MYLLLALTGLQFLQACVHKETLIYNGKTSLLNFQGDDRIRMPVGCQHLYIWQGTGQIILICLGNHTLPFHFQALKEHFENIFNICMTHSSFVYIYIYIYDECKLIPTQRLSAIPTQRFWETQEGIKGLKYEILLEDCILWYTVCHQTFELIFDLLFNVF